MKNLENLVRGYKNFLKQRDKNQFFELAENGQSPKIMIIGCSDSRVNPDMIFNSGPGDLFVVRNVANLVPPYDNNESYQGTSAALEFAVRGLNIEHIVIMGHSLCGGVSACCKAVHDGRSKNIENLSFLPKWTSILNNCATEVLNETPDIDLDTLSRKVELAAVKASLCNLEDFPFIADGLNKGTLQIHGVYFDIKNTQLYALDKEADSFIAIK